MLESIQDWLTERLDGSRSEVWAALVVAVGAFALAIAVISEHGFANEPCSLCLTQRVFLILGCVISVVSLVHNPRLILYPVLAGGAFVAGAGYAGRQIYLIFSDEAAASCGAGLTYLIENDFPLSQILKSMFYGSVECGEFSVFPFLFVLTSLIVVGGSVMQAIASRTDS